MPTRHHRSAMNAFLAKGRVNVRLTGKGLPEGSAYYGAAIEIMIMQPRPFRVDLVGGRTKIVARCKVGDHLYLELDPVTSGTIAAYRKKRGGLLGHCADSPGLADLVAQGGYGATLVAASVDGDSAQGVIEIRPF